MMVMMMILVSPGVIRRFCCFLYISEKLALSEEEGVSVVFLHELEKAIASDGSFLFKMISLSCCGCYARTCVCMYVHAHVYEKGTHFALLLFEQNTEDNAQKTSTIALLSD